MKKRGFVLMTFSSPTQGLVIKKRKLSPSSSSSFPPFRQLLTGKETHNSLN